LDRKELIKAAGKSGSALKGHLAECQECRQAVLMLREYGFSGNLPLANAPEGLIQKAISLAEKPAGLRKTIESIATLIFDSWLMPEPVGVRGQGAIENRRLRYKGDEITFDLRGEHQKSGWSFVAQASGSLPSSTILSADKLSLYPDKHGLFQWQSPKPPRHLLLRSGDKTIKLPEIIWRKPQKK